MQRFALVVLSTFVCIACPQAKDTGSGEKQDGAGGADKAQPQAPQSKAPGTEPDDGEAATPTMQAHMQDHFSKADDIEAALIAGDLERAREPARWMAEHQHEIDHPEPWKPYIQNMRDAAQEIGGAGDLAQASAGFVKMGEACAACHLAIGGPKLEPSTPPAVTEGSGTKPHMAKHQWAVDQMWLGLIGPSREVWIAGAEALADAPLTPEQLAENQTLPPEIQALADRVHALGNEARNVPEASGIPGRIYGELLTTCESCHVALRPK